MSESLFPPSFFFFLNKNSSNLKFPFLYYTVLVAQHKLAFPVKEGPKEILRNLSDIQIF